MPINRMKLNLADGRADSVVSARQPGQRQPGSQKLPETLNAAGNNQLSATIWNTIDWPCTGEK